MSERPSKERRKELVRDWWQRNREKSISELPADNDELNALFRAVEAKTGEYGCDHTLRFTEEAILSLGLARDTVIAWVMSGGGYCDCEVLLNVEPSWLQLIGEG